MMEADSGKPDAIVEYLEKVWDTLGRGGDPSEVSDEEAKKAVMKIRRENHAHKLLKNADIPKLCDEELESAAMDWIRSKIKWSDLYQDLKSLPKPCQNVYSCRTVADEILNGGLNQLFYNSMLPLAELSVEGYSALGAPKLSRVMENAVEVYRQNRRMLDGCNDGSPEGLSAAYNKGLFNELDAEFAAGCGGIGIAGYIREHAVFFGGETTA